MRNSLPSALQGYINLTELGLLPVFRIPENPVADLRQHLGALVGGYPVGDSGDMVVFAENLTHQEGYLVKVFRPDLQEATPRFIEQASGQRQLPVQVVQVRVDVPAVLIPKRLDTKWVVRQIVPAFLGFRLVCPQLEIGAKLDVVWRVDVDHLHLLREALPIGQRGHYPACVTVNQPVLPISLVPVPLEIGVVGQAVELGEQVLLLPFLFFQH